MQQQALKETANKGYLVCLRTPAGPQQKVLLLLQQEANCCWRCTDTPLQHEDPYQKELLQQQTPLLLLLML